LFPLKDNIPTDRFPLVTLVLIAANVVVYFFLQGGGWELTSNATGSWPVQDYAAVPCELSNECPSTGAVSDLTTVFTSMFMHGGLLHLGGNMLFLWIFGNNVEDAMGPVKYLLFYLAGGIAAIALQTVVDLDAAVPTLGASGAVSAVLGAYILLHPRARIITLIFIILFFTVIELPAMVVLGLWFAQQLVFGALDYASAGEGGGVAYFAHIGGFAFGLLVVRLLVRERRETAPARYRV
jgi:membrane associated rhomboid family serine protease